MHSKANPSRIGLCFRHPHSASNASGETSHRKTPIHKLGQKQINPIIRLAIKEGATCLVTSTSDRSHEPAIRVALQKQHKGNLVIYTHPAFNEWEKPAAIREMPPGDPRIKEFSRYRYRHFGPGYRPMYEGEETWEETIDKVEQGLDFLYKTGATHPIFAHIGHRNRLIMMKVRAICGYLDPQLFKHYYNNVGLDNGAMFVLWHGSAFDVDDDGKKFPLDWRTEEGGNYHIPRKFRSS